MYAKVAQLGYSLGKLSCIRIRKNKANSHEEEEGGGRRASGLLQILYKSNKQPSLLFEDEK
jgi:hypothetical protein